MNEQTVNKALFKEWIAPEDASKEFMFAANSIIEHMLWNASCVKPLWRQSKGSKSAAMQIMKGGFKWEIFAIWGVTFEIFEEAADFVLAFYNDGCEMEWVAE